MANKLTKSDVLAILDALARGETQASISARYGVHLGTIGKISNGEIWRHVYDAWHAQRKQAG